MEPHILGLFTSIIGTSAQKLGSASLRDLSTAQVSDLVATYGLTEVAATKAAAVVELARAMHTEPLVRGVTFRASSDVFRAFGPRMRDLKVEQFWVVLLDGKHRVIGEVLVSQGTLTSSPVHPREVFGPAIRSAAAAVVLVHNHPSGDPSPSADDLEITRRLTDAGALVGIRVVDHIIIGDNEWISLADLGLLDR